MDGSTRRRLTALLAACAALASIAVAQAAKETVQTGTFALLGGTATTQAELRTTPATGGSLDVRVRLFQSDGKTPVLAYNVAGDRTMQFLLLRDDFRTFARLHPAVDATTGTFHETLVGVDPTHLYYLFADAIPATMNEQAFRFNLQDEHLPAVPPASTLDASPKTLRVDGYLLTINDTTLPANQASTVLVSIEERGKLPWTLQQYQGAPTSATMIDATTLNVIHVHTLIHEAPAHSKGKSTAQSGPLMQADIPALPAGPYKLWLQFRGSSGKIYTAPFTLVAE